MKRVWWTAFLFGFCCEIVVAFILVVIIGDRPFLGNTLLLFAAIQAGKVALALIGSISSWSYFFVFGKEQRVRFLLDVFVRSKMPKPELYLIDEDEFLLGIQTNEELESQPRLAASELIGFAVGQQAKSPLGEGMRHGIALAEAIERYREI